MKFFISNHSYTPNPDKFSKCSVEECLRYFKKEKTIQLDSETTGFDPHTKELLTLQLGTPQHQFVIDATTVDISQFKDLIEDKSKTIIMHNAKFDLRWLYKYEIIPFGNVFDTFLAERVLSTGIDTHRKSLAACCYRYLKITLPKDIRGSIHKRGVYDEEVLEYAANDVKYLEDIMRAQLEALKRQDLLNAIALDNKFVCVLAYCEYVGIGIDRQKWQEKAEQDKKNMLEKERILDNMVIELEQYQFLNPPDLFSTKFSCAINWSSQKQVIPLMKYLGLDLSTRDKKTGEEKESVESKILYPQIDKHPIVKAYLDYQKAHKLVTTYGESFLKHINPVTGRIHTNFTQIRNTGRLSSGSDAENSDSVNLQNIPRGRERTCFKPKEGNLFAVNDYAS